MEEEENTEQYQLTGRAAANESTDDTGQYQLTGRAAQEENGRAEGPQTTSGAPSASLFEFNSEFSVLGIGYRVVREKKLGMGRFGSVYQCIEIATGVERAVKLEWIEKQGQLLNEKNMLASLEGVPGIPKTYGYEAECFILQTKHQHFGIDRICNGLVIQLLGKSLTDYKSISEPFSIRTVSWLAVKALNILQQVHDHGIVHRDIKPDNFCIGIGSSDVNLYLIDFGLAKRYRDARNNHVKYREGYSSFVGTLPYAPINAHFGRETARRDELESLGYVLIELLTGSLPWLYPPRNRRANSLQ